MWNQKNTTNKVFYKTVRLTDLENEHGGGGVNITREEGLWGVRDWEFGIDVYTLRNQNMHRNE